MGAAVRWTVGCALLSWLGLFLPGGASAQELDERDALCNADGCFVVYFQRKTFLDAWRSCKEKGGNLATAKRQEEADTIAALFSGVELRGSLSRVRVWIGLQRQPRQCSASRPLRGYSWTTGDKDTQYTNWLREDSPSTCQAPRCVVMSYSTIAHEQDDNFKWLDGSCSVPMDGYLCRYTYKGMCPAVWGEGGGNVLYTTPFNLLTTVLTHLPFGSVATVPCPAGAREDERSVLCMMREDGVVGWSKDAPHCSGGDGAAFDDQDEQEEEDWCARDNGGCEHYCRAAGSHLFCECSDGFRLADDGQSCQPADPCADAPCEYECLPLSDGYRCACPEGYMLAPDEQGCLDVDECLQSPCQQLCVNAPGTFECRCREGFRPDDDGECEDVDECVEDDPCEHACENTPGSHVCHCHLGFSPLPEDPRRCQDMDECAIPMTCEQMCVNYEGGFACYCEVGYELMEDLYSCRKIDEAEEGGSRPTAATPAWATRQPGPGWADALDPIYRWTPEEDSQTHWSPEEGEEHLDWLTDPPRVESDVIWVTSLPQERPTFNPTAPLPRGEAEQEPEVPDWLGEGEALGDWETTPGTSTVPPTSPTPDWYEEGEEEEDEESTTNPTALPTTTVSEGAWNWLPANQVPVWGGSIVEQDTPGTEYPNATDDGAEDEDGDDVTTQDSSESDKREVAVVGEEEENEERAEEEEEAVTSPTGVWDTLSLPPAPSLAPGRGEAGEEVRVPVGEGSGQSGGGSWLLVGLLVPLCIFVVIMVALGIVYCTRCAVQPRNKSATDCYHWISGAHDKQGAPGPGAVGKTHV